MNFCSLAHIFICLQFPKSYLPSLIQQQKSRDHWCEITTNIGLWGDDAHVFALVSHWVLVFVVLGLMAGHYQNEADTKWPTFCRRQFQMHFHEWKFWNFQQKIHWDVFLWVSIGSGNGLAPIRRQIITLTNGDEDHWRICVTRPHWVADSIGEIWGVKQGCLL